MQKDVRISNGCVILGDAVLDLSHRRTIKDLLQQFDRQKTLTRDDILKRVYDCRDQMSERMEKSLGHRCTKLISRLRLEMKRAFGAQRDWNFLRYHPDQRAWSFCVPA